jgi:hypothetical protein
MHKSILFLTLLVVAVLGFFTVSAIEDRIERRFSDHPRVLCGTWFWDVRDGSAVILLGDGSSFIVSSRGERSPVRWNCRNGVMRVSDPDGSHTHVWWTEWNFTKEGDLYGSNLGPESEPPAACIFLKAPANHP